MFGEFASAIPERADLGRERKELAADPTATSTREMTAIYVKRGLDAELASNVATPVDGA